MKITVKQLVFAGLMAALVTVGTMLIQIPSPTKGYIHIGDTIVYLSGILLGPVVGGLAAAVGSGLADLFTGYLVYAPVTFIVKGLDAMIVGFIYHKLVNGEATKGKKLMSFAAAVFGGGVIMVGGYLVYESFLYGFVPALAGVPGNLTQAIGGGILAAPLLLALGKLNIIESRKESLT
ncbi:Uncharacterized membrane protein [Desulfonispora thiosulfatigenes DSM 11270]|uniref:Uncharacterized membrane protein n=1 Tax=Desulfonispora thiosulfatigenes DSM 11270 TaxID=656914 RepID=A0A1W1V1A1_DESTI|nr:ECF transporter S component [Desulfonispora thiosulfatigenes]SMB86781.1 Uncharacterized membrane protein [Desulfonispora thiosulfatigenes DSM 11270]